LNIVASKTRDGRGDDPLRSIASSLERGAGGVTAIVVAAARRAVATAIFKHVDIDAPPKISLGPLCMLAPACEKDLLADV
jgi:hypothetical protein